MRKEIHDIIDYIEKNVETLKLHPLVGDITTGNLHSYANGIFDEKICITKSNVS